MVNALFPLTAWPLKKSFIHHQTPHPQSLQIITLVHGWPLVVVARSGGGVICRGWSIMPMAPLHQDLDKILLGSKSMGEVSHSTQHMPTLLYFNWSHWSHIKTYLITATCQEGVSIVIWNHFRWSQRHFMVTHSVKMCKIVYLYNSLSLRQYIFVPNLPLKGS